MRRTMIPPEISRMLGGFLSRTGIVRVLAALHEELPRLYPLLQDIRHPDDERYFSYPLSVADGETVHGIYFVVDDSTSPDHLIIADFVHEVE